MALGGLFLILACSVSWAMVSLAGDHKQVLLTFYGEWSAAVGIVLDIDDGEWGRPTLAIRISQHRRSFGGCRKAGPGPDVLPLVCHPDLRFSVFLLVVVVVVVAAVVACSCSSPPATDHSTHKA